MQVARIDQLEQRIALYEDEINRLRDHRLQTTRNFTDKSITDQQINELKHKVSEFFSFHEKLFLSFSLMIPRRTKVN